jgi:hypothetical protein
VVLPGLAEVSQTGRYKFKCKFDFDHTLNAEFTEFMQQLIFSSLSSCPSANEIQEGALSFSARLPLSFFCALC